MISTIGNKPILKVGNHYITSYDVSWLSLALDQAAHSFNGENIPFRDDLIRGIKMYLEELCAIHILSIEDLFEKIRSMLRQIGLHSIAEHLKNQSPPFTLDLEIIAKECPLPLFFYSQLRRELNDLCHSGITSCSFTGIREASLTLENQKQWGTSCDLRAHEITLFIRNLWLAEQNMTLQYY